MFETESTTLLALSQTTDWLWNYYYFVTESLANHKHLTIVIRRMSRKQNSIISSLIFVKYENPVNHFHKIYHKISLPESSFFEIQDFVALKRDEEFSFSTSSGLLLVNVGNHDFHTTPCVAKCCYFLITPFPIEFVRFRWVNQELHIYCHWSIPESLESLSGRIVLNRFWENLHKISPTKIHKCIAVPKKFAWEISNGLMVLNVFRQQCNMHNYLLAFEDFEECNIWNSFKIVSMIDIFLA